MIWKHIAVDCSTNTHMLNIPRGNNKRIIEKLWEEE